MNKWWLIGCWVLGCLVAGCGGKAAQKEKPVFIPPPKPPIPPPARVDQAIDVTLRTQAIGELNRSYHHPDDVIRANAIEATQRAIGVAGAPAILNALEDPSPLVRFAASMAAGELQLREAQPRLLANLRTLDQLETEASNSSDSFERAEARRVLSVSEQIGIRYALHKLGITRYSHDLEKFAVDRSPRVRANTVMVLGLLGEKSALKILATTTNDPDPSVQLQSVEARYKLGDQTALEDLAVASVSKFPDDQIIALLALGSSKDERNARLISGKLTSDYMEVSLAAARALGMLGNDLGMGVALKAVESKEPRQRALAALALGAIGRTDAQDELARLLRDSDASVRLSAAQAILQLKAG